MSSEQLYDVVAVDTATNIVQPIAYGRTLTYAEYLINLAVSRRGVEHEFFVEVRQGTYKEGEFWEGQR